MPRVNFGNGQKTRLVVGIAAINDRDGFLQHLVGLELPPSLLFRRFKATVSGALFTFTFFFVFLSSSSNVTAPVGTPRPEPEGAISTVNWTEVGRTNVRFCFLKNWLGTMTTFMPVCVTVTRGVPRTMIFDFRCPRCSRTRYPSP